MKVKEVKTKRTFSMELGEDDMKDLIQIMKDAYLECSTEELDRKCCEFEQVLKDALSEGVN